MTAPRVKRPLHVEYPLTPFGVRLLGVLDAIDRLDLSGFAACGGGFNREDERLDARTRAGTG